VTFTAFAQEINSTWPFVTMNDFQERAASTRSLSGAYKVEILPIVTDQDRAEWEAYSVANKDWLDQGRAYQSKYHIGASSRHLQLQSGDAVTGNVVLNFTAGASSISNISNRIFTLDSNSKVVVDPGPGPYYPVWQSSPILPEPRDMVNYNVETNSAYGPYIKKSAETGQISIGGLDTAEPGNITNPGLLTSFFAYLLSFDAGKWVDYNGEPMSSVYIPVFDSFEDNRKTVAVLLAVIKWRSYFENIQSPNSLPVRVVLENNCQGPFTYEIRGFNASYIGKGRQVNHKYDDMATFVELNSKDFVIEKNTLSLTLNQDLCHYSLWVYPTSEMDNHYNNAFPMIIAIVIAAVFIFTVGTFLLYDMHVERRQRLVLDTAKRSTAIVSSIFPKNVRDQLMGSPVQGNATKLRSLVHTANSDPTFMKESNRTQDLTSGGPIADLFPECTVMMADIEGFTAWSSVREPSQVFTLLETIYNAFDRVAARRRVFKVETV
jgi:hypothetical protein